MKSIRGAIAYTAKKLEEYGIYRKNVCSEDSVFFACLRRFARSFLLRSTFAAGQTALLRWLEFDRISEEKLKELMEELKVLNQPGCS